MVLPCLMSAFNSIGGSCFGCIKTEAAHLFAYGDNIENLRTQVQNLSAAIKSVKDRIEEAESEGATLVDAVVALLLTRMASLKEEASKIISDEEREADSRCLMGLRPNLWACYLASKSAKKAIDEVAELLKKVNELNSPVATVDYSQSSTVTPFPDFEEFKSRASVSNEIVAALKDPNVNKVGVYGMGGTGKTTLAEKIGADLKENGTFSFVILAIISQNQSLLQNNYQSDLTSIQKQIASIQEQIAGGLKIQLQGKTLNDRATQLREQLRKREKLLIILDDIWSKFELKDVGIPVGSSVHAKFKILMTSRNKLVLENEMDSTNNFGLDSLPFDDAWQLFDRMVGGDSQYSNWRSTAEQVVEQCGGIPILLATTARALRNANRSIWEDALIQLKKFHGVDYGEEAYKRIEVSYKFLKSEEIKKLLLLCAQLNHRSIRFEQLLRYTMGLDLFKESKKLKEVSGRLHKYLRELKGCCLLQDGNKEGMIKMHDVVHKFASIVAFRDHHMFSVAADGELQEWPSKDELTHFSAISLPFCHLPPDHMLPLAFVNPKLESFLMLRSEIDASFKIPDNFFAGMKGLKLMDLTMMSLSPVLVSSLSALEKIRTLCLDGCELGDIAVIGELPKLQALSLVGSSIVCVPKEMGKLGSTLKLLDLRKCSKLKSVASGVISRLTLLEDLRIGDSFSNWEQLQRSSSNNISADETYEAEMASLEEFKNLRNLINLEIHIREHAKMFPKDLVFKKLETFRIFIGSFRDYRDIHILPRTLEVKEFSIVVEFDNEGTKALMTRAESLRLEGVESSESVSEMDPKGFPELKHLNVNHSVFFSTGEVQYIVKKNYNNCIFPKLETLHISMLRKLERICDDHDHPLPVGSFENLRVIKVRNCDLLNDLLSSNLARGLLRLKEIRVEYCKSMESIIVSRESENEEEIKIGFTDELRVLELKGLPRLLSFYRFKPLEGVPVPSGTPHFNKKVAFPNLEKLEIFGCDSLEKVFDVQILAMNERETCRILPFQNLREVIVFGCPALTSIFPTSLLPTLQQLERLEVGNCDKIDLFGFNNTPQLNDAIAKVISCLKCYHLESGGIIVQKNEDQRFKLKILGCGFQVSPILFALFKSFPKLDKVVVSSCSILQLFPCEPDHLAADDGGDMDTQEETFARIQHLQLRELSNMKHILSEHSPLKYHGVPRDLKVLKVVDCDSLLSLAPPSTTLFKNLTRLVVRRCRMLIKLIASSNSAKSLVNLKEMIVRECDSLEEIVVLDDQWDELSSNDKCIVFEKLEVLELQDLNSLTSFYSTANCNFRFPLLNRVIVKNCPKMKCFSKGALSTPKLIRVWDFWVKDAAEEERRQNEAKWEGDLNSTIRKFFETEYYDCVWHSRLGWESWE